MHFLLAFNTAVFYSLLDFGAIIRDIVWKNHTSQGINSTALPQLGIDDIWRIDVSMGAMDLIRLIK